jgi:hypothetical protein
VGRPDQTAQNSGYAGTENNDASEAASDRYDHAGGERA